MGEFQKFVKVQTLWLLLTTVLFSRRMIFTHRSYKQISARFIFVLTQL